MNTTPKKLTKEHVLFIKQVLTSSPFTTGRLLQNKVQRVFGTQLSLSLCYTAIKQAGMSRVKVKTHYRSKKHPERMVQFGKEIDAALDGNQQLVFIDEIGFRANSVPFYGYVERGKELVRYIGSKCHRKSYSSCVATNQHGILHRMHLNHSFTGSSFLSFLTGLNVPPGTCLVMDNASIHKTKAVREYIQTRHWTTIFLPPGMPDFNPVENLFGIVKSKYRVLNSFADSSEHAKIGHVRLIETAFRQAKSEWFLSLFERARTLWNLVLPKTKQ